MFQTLTDWVAIHRPCKENPYRTNSMMSKEIKDDAARKEFIKEFSESYYKDHGYAEAKEVVSTINSGVQLLQDPLHYQDTISAQDDVMLATAAYLADNVNDPSKQLREDYLSTKFIIALNKACNYLGLENYVKISDEDLAKDRTIVFDEPDFDNMFADFDDTDIPDCEREFIEKAKKDVIEYAKMFNKMQQDIEDRRNDMTAHNAAVEYNNNLRKKLSASSNTKNEKKEKEAEKIAENKSETEKLVENKNESELAKSANDIPKTDQVKPRARKRSFTSRGVNSVSSSTNNTAAEKSAEKGGNGKKEESSDSGDPDPASSKKKINLDEVIPIEQVIYPLIEVDGEDRERLLAQNEQERIEFIRANGGGELRNNARLSNTKIPDNVAQAIAAAANQMRMNQGTVTKESGRFTLKEINSRTDIQLIQDSLNEACSSMKGVSASVTPTEIDDQYKVYIMLENVMVDNFDAYGSKIFGKGCPVLNGRVQYGKDQFGPYFVPLHSITAVRQNIFRNIDCTNKDGEKIDWYKGTPEAFARQLNDTICINFNLLDHLDISDHAFESDKEAADFFHVAGAAITKYVAETQKSPSEVPIFRVANYKAYNKFDLFASDLAYQNKGKFKADTLTFKVQMLPDNIAPDYYRLMVKGKNLVIDKPGSNTIRTTMEL